MSPRTASACILLLLAAVSAAMGHDMLTNGSFEMGMNPWRKATGYSIQVVNSGWNGVSAIDGGKFLAVSGPATVGLTYVDLVTQSLTPPFGGDIPEDNILLYLYAAAYLHTNDGRKVSFALVIDPGYSTAGSAFCQGAQDAWIVCQTSAPYLAHDPYDASSPVKPLKVILELREPLQAGEYLLLDAVSLYYGGEGA